MIALIHTAFPRSGSKAAQKNGIEFGLNERLSVDLIGMYMKIVLSTTSIKIFMYASRL